MEKKNFYEQLGVAMTCRSFAEYESMFALEKSDLQEGPILDIASGASSFTAMARNHGYEAFAVDPLYKFTSSEMEQHGRTEHKIATDKIAELAHKFQWEYYGDLERYQALREQSLSVFLESYASPEADTIYIPADLPALPFADHSFSLLLCSHFLFLYQEQFDYEFHLNALMEMVRVTRQGGQIRIYPLVDLKWNRYPHLNKLIDSLKKVASNVSLQSSQLPFIPSSTEMLMIIK